MSESSNGTAVLEYNPTKFGNEILPDAPEGGWEMTILRGKSKVGPTKNKDPMLTISVKLDRADEDENESAQGTQLTVRFIFGDDSGARKWALNRTKRELNAVCGQLDLDPGAYTLSGTRDPGEQRAGFIQLIEGKSLKGYTTHRVNKQTGFKETNVTFVRPSQYAGAANVAASDD